MLQGQSFVYSASAYPSLRYPPMYAQLCELLDGLQLDVLQMLPLGCVFPVSFHASMLARTLLPLVLIAVLRIIQALARSAAVKDACGSTAFFIIFLVYPGCSMKVFSTLQCVPIDDGTRWLRADLSINCDAPTHQIMTVYAWAMVVIYPIGVPVYFAVQMWLTRRQLAELQRLEKRAEAHQSLRKTAASALQVAPTASPPPSPPGAALGRESVTFAPAGNPHRRRSSVSALIRRRTSQVSTSRRLSTLSPELLREKTRKGRYEDIILPETVVKLIQGYELRVYWFEIVECVRKLALVCMPVFFEMGSPSQLTFGLLTCFISFGLFMYLQPFAEESDDALAQLCQGQTFVALASSMMLSADLDKNGPGSRNLDFVLCLLTFLPLVFGTTAAIVDPKLRLPRQWWQQLQHGMQTGRVHAGDSRASAPPVTDIVRSQEEELNAVKMRALTDKEEYERAPNLRDELHERALQSKSDDAKHMHSEIKSVKSELRQKEAELWANKAKLQAKEAELQAELQAKEAELKANKAELQAREAELQAELQAKEAELKANKAELQAREAELQAKDAEIHTIGQNRPRLHKELQQLRTEIAHELQDSHAQQLLDTPHTPRASDTADQHARKGCEALKATERQGSAAPNPSQRRSSVSGLIRRRMSQVSPSRRRTLSPELLGEKMRKGIYKNTTLPEVSDTTDQHARERCEASEATEGQGVASPNVTKGTVTSPSPVLRPPLVGAIEVTADQHVREGCEASNSTERQGCESLNVTEGTATSPSPLPRPPLFDAIGTFTSRIQQLLSPSSSNAPAELQV